MSTYTPLHLPVADATSGRDYASLIEAGRDGLALQLAARHPDQSLAWADFDPIVTRQAWIVRGRPVFGSLFFMPVIRVRSGEAVDDQSLLADSKNTLPKALIACLDDRVATCNWGMWTYAHLSACCPSLLKARSASMFQSVATTGPKFMAQPIALPPGLPELSFLVVGLASRKGWPERPRADAAPFHRLAQHVGAALQHSSVSPPLVLSLQTLHNAAEQGLCAWLRSIHFRCPITRWAIEPLPDPIDAVRVAIRMDTGDDPFWTEFILRKHQCGQSGFQKLCFLLSSLGEMVPPALMH